VPRKKERPEEMKLNPAKQASTEEKDKAKRRLEGNPEYLENLGKLRSDKDIVLFAVRREGRALRFASEEMKSNKSVVLAAVTNNGLALEYASEKLRNDEEVVKKAYEQNKGAYKYAGTKGKLSCNKFRIR
jgi:hypothetical protein